MMLRINHKLHMDAIHITLIMILSSFFFCILLQIMVKSENSSEVKHKLLPIHLPTLSQILLVKTYKSNKWRKYYSSLKQKTQHLSLTSSRMPLFTNSSLVGSLSRSILQLNISILEGSTLTFQRQDKAKETFCWMSFLKRPSWHNC